MGLLNLWDFLGPFPGTAPDPDPGRKGSDIHDDAQERARARLFEIIPEEKRSVPANGTDPGRNGSTS